MGRAGRSAALALADHAGADGVAAWDAATSPLVAQVAADLSARGIACTLGGDGTAAVADLSSDGCVVKSPGIPPGVPLLRAAGERGLLVIDEAELGWRLDSRPMVGVTGTNGKSTVCSLVAAVLADAGGTPVVAGNTAFGPPLSSLRAFDADLIVAELSSFQLAGSPALLPDAAVFTNLADDHWEHHGGRESYLSAKRRMLVRGDRCVPLLAANRDDPVGASFARRVMDMGGTVWTYGWGAADVRVVAHRWTLAGGEVELAVRGRSTVLATRLPGAHNAMNVAAALALAGAMRIDLDRAALAIAGADPVAGRFEVIDEAQPFHAIVDYAHNPAGVRAALTTVRRADASPPVGRVIVVTSALGAIDDRQHREAAWELRAADEVIVSVERFSPDDPHDPPDGLVDGLAAAGVPTTVVPDRRVAIRRAIARARPNDAVLILNRGARRSPSLDAHDLPYVVDDRGETRAAIREIAG